jgi:hypothetical protein
LGEIWGEGLSANCNHKIAAGFSPQSVQEFFVASKELKELTEGSSQLTAKARLNYLEFAVLSPHPDLLPKGLGTLNREGGKSYRAIR